MLKMRFKSALNRLSFFKLALLAVIFLQILLPQEKSSQTVVFAAGEREEICLNGDAWLFKPIKLPFFGYEESARDSELNRQFIRDAINNPANDWTNYTSVRVPMSWTCQGDFNFPSFWQYAHKAEYKRSFDVPASFAGKRIKLAFGGVNFKCWVYVNGTLLKAEGPANDYTHLNKLGFEVDLAGYVTVPSTGNELKVVVQDYSAAFAGAYPNEDSQGSISYPLGHRREYYTTSPRSWRIIDIGILQDVILKSTPKMNLEDVFIKTSKTNGNIVAVVTIRNEDTISHTVTIENSVKEKVSGITALTFSNPPSVTLAPGETKTQTIIQSWAGPHLWWPHDPFLYNLNTTVKESGGTIDVKVDQFGFREIRAVKSTDSAVRGLYLNDLKINLRGESVEPTWKDSYSEGVGTSGLYMFNAEYWSYLIDTAKSMNINVLRPHRGQMTGEMMDIADQKGMLILAESTIFCTKFSEPAGTLDNQLKSVRDLVKSFRNHPSIISWSLANESNYNSAWATEANTYDGTRPLVATDVGPQSSGSLLCAGSDGYAFGLSGYQSGIYNQWDNLCNGGNLVFIYEDNACYDEPSVSARVSSVQKGMSIFRGHRTTGYEMIFTFYTFQKVFGQPTTPGTKLLPISWSTGEKNGKGYHPDFAKMPLFDPWTNRSNPGVINPITGYTDLPIDFWKRTYSPVAVFDYDYDARTDISSAANPYWGALSVNRRLTIFNDDDARDVSAAIHVTYEAKDSGNGTLVDSGSFDVNVPVGGRVTQNITLNYGGTTSVAVTYKAYKSSVKRFEETIYLRGENGIIVDNTDSGFTSDTAWATSTAISGYYGSNYAHDGTSGADSAKWAKWTPNIAMTGNYDVYMRWTADPNRPDAAPLEIKYNGGTDTSKTVNQTVDNGTWVKIGTYNLAAGTGNYVKISASDAGYTVADAVKFVSLSAATPTPTPAPSPTPTPTPTPAGSWNLVNDDLDNFTAGWSTTGTGGSVTQNSGYVTIIDGSASYYYMTKNSFTLPTGAFTFEVRAKAKASGTTNDFTVRSGSYTVSLFLTYGTSGKAQDRETGPTKTYTLDTTVYHTYRIVVHSGFSYDLYVDGALAWSGSASYGTGTNIFKIGGSGNTGITANIDVDYARMGTGEIIP
jgi:hypothetical protein